MYQFYYADPTKAVPLPDFQQNIRDHFQITAVRPAMWEEHCLECAAPLCFGTCSHYEARSDGRCKRFCNGLLTFSHDRACCGQGVHVRFRKWANMMTVLFPAMLSEADYCQLQRRNETLGKLLRTVEHSKLPRSLRWQGIRIPEYLRRRNLRKLSGQENRPDAFLFHGWSHTQDSYHLIVEVFDDHTPVFRTALSIHPGENLHIVTDLSDQCAKAGNLVKVYPEHDVEAELDLLWCDFVRGVPAASASTVKCLVWDLDETLWNGTLIEMEDPAALALKPGVLETVRALDEAGILQSIASKNDHDAAWPVLERLGVADYFLYPQIHWGAKSGSLEHLAKTLNIGIDSLALIDDSAFEREQVRSVWPQVRTYDPVELGSLLHRREFQVPVTAESRNRRAMYQAEARRTQVREAAHADPVDFLRSCHLRAELLEPRSEDVRLRCYELVNRTNQLNMTGKKYTPEEFRAVLDRPDHRSFALACADDFGDYGIVGFGQYRVEGKALVFTEFAMSCRVAGKYVESALFATLLAQTGCAEGRFPVIVTKKNQLLRTTLEQIGFRAAEADTQHTLYTFTSDLRHCDIVAVENRESIE